MKNLIITIAAFFVSFSSFALFGPITGTGSICTGSTDYLYEDTTGGTWSCTSSHLSINPSSGLISGISAGTAIVTYTIGTDVLTHPVTVTPSPAVIMGPTHVCQGSTITLLDATPGGTWSDPATGTIAGVLSVDSVTGVVSGLSSGTKIVSYTTANGCYSVMPISVYPSAPILGSASACPDDTMIFSNAVPGGTWTSSLPGIASYYYLSTFVAWSSGTTVISYNTSAGCTTTKTVTVLPMPSAILGTPSLCLGSTTTLADMVPGGVWTSSAPLVAPVGSASGIVSGIISGPSIITYTLGTGCSVTTTITVGPLPSSVFTVTGGGSYCAGGTGTTIGLSGSVPGTVYGLFTGGTMYYYALGTGAPISLSAISLPGVYSIIANPGSTCTTTMSGSATVSITPTVTPTDSIIVSPGSTVCQGTMVYFTVVSSGGGTSPYYVWFKNGSAVTPGITFSYIPANGDVLFGILSSSAPCASPASVLSNTITMTVDVPTVTATASPASCGGTSTLTATGAFAYSWLPPSGLACATCGTTSLFPPASAIYTVTGTDALGCSDTATIAVDGNRIYGHISYTGLSTDTLNVWLIQFNPADSSIAAVDSQYTCMDSGSPYFEFDDVTAGNYMVKAALLGTIPGTSGYVPTYSLSSPHWDSAVTIAHGSSADAMNITMVYGTVPSGPGFIAGYVYAGAGKATSGDAPVQGMLIYLQDALGHTITSAITDGTGAYSFSNIAEGSYYVYPENYKYYTTTSALITLSSGSDTVTSVNFKQHTTFGTITPYDFTKVPQPVITTGLSLYPNPTTGNLNIQWTNQATGNATISVSDMTGREVYTTSYRMNAASGKTEIDLGSLENGMYLINIKSDKVLYSDKLARISN